jgi:hypothetical protein
MRLAKAKQIKKSVSPLSESLAALAGVTFRL